MEKDQEGSRRLSIRRRTYSRKHNLLELLRSIATRSKMRVGYRRLGIRRRAWRDRRQGEGRSERSRN